MLLEQLRSSEESGVLIHGRLVHNTAVHQRHTQQTLETSIMCGCTQQAVVAVVDAVCCSSR